MTTPICWSNATRPSAVSEVANTLDTPASAHRLPGPYRRRKSRFGSAPCTGRGGGRTIPAGVKPLRAGVEGNRGEDHERAFGDGAVPVRRERERHRDQHDRR